jgi:hypothetical protein
MMSSSTSKPTQTKLFPLAENPSQQCFSLATTHQKLSQIPSNSGPQQHTTEEKKKKKNLQIIAIQK